MKTLFLLVLLCTTTIEPPTNFNGIFWGNQSQKLVNLGWNSPYVGATYQIKRNGAIVKQGVNQPYNVVSIPVESNFKQATFSISQSVDGVSSQEIFTVVRK